MQLFQFPQQWSARGQHRVAAYPAFLQDLYSFQQDHFRPA